MTATIYSESGQFVRSIQATPRCGKDFCDRCSDCLKCYNWKCIDGKGCIWILYEGQDELPEDAS